MKHFPFHLLLLAAAITLASCSGDTPGEDTLPAIGFTTQTTDTRAVVESPADMTAFQVWGWYGTTASLTNVFNGDEVRHTGTGGYHPETFRRHQQDGRRFRNSGHHQREQAVPHLASWTRSAEGDGDFNRVRRVHQRKTGVIWI